MEPILQRIADFIQRQELAIAGDRILVAISGGADSVFLAYALKQLGYEIGLAHINYQLRGEESDEEEALVRQYADTWKVPLYVLNEDTPSLLQFEKDSLQQVARRIRYEFFEELMDEQGYDCCALAHQADDQSEQAVLSLLTGNASDILQQIPVKRERYVRPLLCCSREEIVKVLVAEKLTYATDSSNLKNDYLRNRVRNQVIPIMEEVNSNTSEQLRQKQSKYAAQKEFLDIILDSWMKSCLLTEEEYPQQVLDWRPFVDTWGKAHLPLLIAYILEKWGMHGHQLWQGVSLIEAQVGKKVFFEDKMLLRIRNGLQWGREVLSEEKTIEWSKAHLQEMPFRVDWGNWTLEIHILGDEKPQLSSKQHFYLDIDRLSFPLALRHWQEGDVMQPLGMTGHKRLSDIFVDEKYTSVQKRQAFVLEDREKVLLLSDFRIADSVRLTAATERILVLKYYEKNNRNHISH